MVVPIGDLFNNLLAVFIVVGVVWIIYKKIKGEEINLKVATNQDFSDKIREKIKR